MTIRRREPGIDDQPRAVLHQGVADEAELRLHAGSLAIEPGLGVGRALVALVRALRALEVDLEMRPPPEGGSSESVSPLGRKLFIEAHASMSVPSTLKCSLDRSRFTPG